MLAVRDDELDVGNVVGGAGRLGKVTDRLEKDGRYQTLIPPPSEFKLRAHMPSWFAPPPSGKNIYMTLMICLSQVRSHSLHL